MKFLFYIEPWIELNEPFMKKNWVRHFLQTPINKLEKHSNKVNEKIEYIYIIGDGVELALKEVKFNLKNYVTIGQKELLNIFPNGYYKTINNWYNKTYSQYDLDNMSKLIKEKTNNYKPDIIITFSPSPFLEKLYKDSLILYMEYGIFSRPPFPKSWYLDFCGNIKNSYLVKYKKQLLSLKDTKASINFLHNIRNTYITLFKEKNPFKHVNLDPDGKFSKKILLPLQFSNYYVFDNHLNKSQFEYVCHIFNHIDKDIGVVVTEHPHFPQITNDIDIYLKNKYPNYIYSPIFSDYENSSQYLLSQVDGVITVSSTIGLQCLLWKKPVFVIGNSHISVFSEENDIRKIGGYFKQNKMSRNYDAALYHLITHYYVTSHYFHNGKWLYDFFKDSLSKFRNKKMDFDFYDPIDNTDTLLKNIISSVNKNIPQERGRSKENAAFLTELESIKNSRAYKLSKILSCVYLKIKRIVKWKN